MGREREVKHVERALRTIEFVPVSGGHTETLWDNDLAHAQFVRWVRRVQIAFIRRMRPLWSLSENA